MNRIQWSDKLILGIEEIDAQHKWLIDSMNRFYDKYDFGVIDQNINEILLDMKDYVHEHFRYEEDFLERHRYPRLESHKQAHTDISLKIAAFENRYKTDGVLPLDEIAGFLLDGPFEHIMKVDSAYVDFIKVVREE